MTDRIDDLFGDITPGGDYPGKREPANRKVKTKGGPQELEEWDDHPRLMFLHGVKTEFFTIRHVGLALHRSARTIRMWEGKEIIPPARFRSAKPHASPIKQLGDRLWTRAQVEAMVRIAREERILDGFPPGPRFTAKLVQAFLALQEHTHRNT